ncbi:DinB family protein [Cytobacillus depressus]|uniref:DinB family protein n=1 Tax=Cytobacillus depressus TaxID=1602942 RepID=A0A6L3V3R4_9BACI|nr:DinB family protein [Cytobacillus depressus]KAB2332071.1 DinB family protein [Cytobacillus depressus]
MKQRHEVLFRQLENYRNEVLDAVDKITAEEAEIIPKAFNNNIRWNLGHIFLDQYLWIQAVTKEKTVVPDQFNVWFGFGTTPANFSEETPSFEELKRMLKYQPLHIKETYGNHLEVEFEATEMGMNTIEQVLIRTIFHEGMHLQAIIDLIKCINAIDNIR